MANALDIYRAEFQPSAALESPYTIAGINAFVADTDEQAERLFTTLIKMFVGVLTGTSTALQPPTAMTDELRTMLQHPAVNQMLKYSFVGSKETVKEQVQAFLKDTQVDELIVVTPTHALEDRIKSVQLFAEVMDEINAKASYADLTVS